MENSVISKLTKTIFLSQSIQSAAQVTMMTILSISAFKISGQESLSSLPHSVLNFAPALTAYSMRLVMNRLGWRFGLALGYSIGALGAVAGLLAVLTNNFLLLVLGAFFLGSARASGDLSRYAVGQMFESNRRARMIGRILGPLLSPWAAGFAPNLNIPPDAGIWGLSSILYFSASLFILLFLFPDPNKFSHQNEEINLKEKVTKNSPV